MISYKVQLKVQLKTVVYPCMCSNSGVVLGKAWWVRWTGTISLMFSLHFLKHPGYFLLLLFSCSVMSDSLPPHGLQHARFPCLLLSPGVSSNSCPLSWWCYPTISFSVTPFSSCLQSFPAKSDRWIQGIIACLERNATWSHVNHDKWISKPEWTFKAF